MAKIGINKVITLTGHNDCVYTVHKAPGQGKFISGAGDGLVAIWGLNGNPDGQLLAKVTNSVYAICPVMELNLLVVGQNYEGIHIIDIEERKEKGSLNLGKATIFDIHFIDGRIVVANSEGVLQVIDLKTLTIIKQIRKSRQSARTITSNGKDMAVGYSDNVIRIFDMSDFSLKHEINAHDNSVFTLSYSPDDRFLFSGSRDAHMKIWDADHDYRLKESIVAHMYTINSISFSPDQEHFATGSMDKTIKIWDYNSLKLLKVIDKVRHGGHLSSVNKIFWSSYKNRLISCSDDRTITVWDINFNSQP